MRVLVVLIISICASLVAVGQKNAKADADKAFSNGEYKKAGLLYRQALVYINKQHHVKGTMKIKADITFQIAECCRMIGDLKHEITMYEKALKAKCTDSLAARQYLQQAKDTLQKQQQ